jgi:SET domain-containing protein
MLPLNYITKIQPSPVHGLGVFASRNIPKGTSISTFHGEEMTWKEFKAKYGSDMRYTYVRMPWLPLIVAKEKRNLITYVNDGYFKQDQGHHNCVLKKQQLIAIEDIVEGQELLIQYRHNYFKNPATLN